MLDSNLDKSARPRDCLTGNGSGKDALISQSAAGWRLSAGWKVQKVIAAINLFCLQASSFYLLVASSSSWEEVIWWFVASRGNLNISSLLARRLVASILLSVLFYASPRLTGETRFGPGPPVWEKN